MSSPRSGFRRAAATSWALAGLGVAGVAGASALAYADTVKPAVAELPAEAVEPVISDAAPLNLPAVPVAPPTVLAPPVPLEVPAEPAPVAAPEPVQQAPVKTYVPEVAPEPVYTPKPVQTYTPEPVQQAPVQQAPAAAAQPAFPIRTSHVPSGGSTTTSGGNAFSPHVTRARGS